eukprot:sb/3478901/
MKINLETTLLPHPPHPQGPDPSTLLITIISHPLYLCCTFFSHLSPLALFLSLSLSLSPLHAPLPHGTVRSHVRAGLNPPGPDPVGSEGPEGLRSKGR